MDTELALIIKLEFTVTVTVPVPVQVPVVPVTVYVDVVSGDTVAESECIGFTVAPALHV